MYNEQNENGWRIQTWKEVSKLVRMAVQPERLFLTEKDTEGYYCNRTSAEAETTANKILNAMADQPFDTLRVWFSEVNPKLDISTWKILYYNIVDDMHTGENLMLSNILLHSFSYFQEENRVMIIYSCPYDYFYEDRTDIVADFFQQ